MSKRTEFNTAMKEALKNKDHLALSTIRLITAALKDKDIAARPQGVSEGVSDAEILSLLQSMVKQRRESAKMYRDGAREDLATREEEEIKIIERFLPQQLDDAKVMEILEKIVSETGATSVKDMGKIMAALKAGYAGQMDMGKVGGLVKARLGG